MLLSVRLYEGWLIIKLSSVTLSHKGFIIRQR